MACMWNDCQDTYMLYTCSLVCVTAVFSFVFDVAGIMIVIIVSVGMWLFFVFTTRIHPKTPTWDPNYVHFLIQLMCFRVARTMILQTDVRNASVHVEMNSMFPQVLLNRTEVDGRKNWTKSVTVTWRIRRAIETKQVPSSSRGSVGYISHEHEPRGSLCKWLDTKIDFKQEENIIKPTVILKPYLYIFANMFKTTAIFICSLCL